MNKKTFFLFYYLIFSHCIIHTMHKRSPIKKIQVKRKTPRRSPSMSPPNSPRMVKTRERASTVYVCPTNLEKIASESSIHRITTAQRLTRTISAPIISDKEKNFRLLMQAIKQGDSNKVADYIKNPLNINQLSINQRTPLALATLLNHTSIVLTLLRHHADPNIRGFYGNTPLHIAVQKGYKEIIELLLRAGAHIDTKNNKGATPKTLFDIAKKQYQELKNIEFKQNTIATAEKKSKRFTYFINAIRAGNQKDVLALIKKIKRVNGKNKEGNRPLHTAVKFNRYFIAELLIKYKAHINFIDDNQQTPLHYAALNGNEQMVKLLLITNGANPNVLNKNKITPLHFAAMKGFLTIVIQLLKSYADPNIQNNNQDTSLHLAVHQGHVPVIRTLLEHGAKVHLENQNKKTAYMIAYERLQKQLDDKDKEKDIESLSQFYKQQLTNIGQEKIITKTKQEINHILTTLTYIQIIQLLLQAQTDQNQNTQDRSKETPD